MAAYVSAFLIGLFLLLPLPAKAAEPTQITVTGTGTATRVPDEAVVNATVATNAPTAAAAVGENESTYERVVAAVVGLGIARSDITLSFYNIGYSPRPENPQPYGQYGYTVTRTFRITARQTSLAGKIVDAASGAGVTEIGGVYFGLSDTAGAVREATAKALADAAARANAIAADEHLRITGIVAVGTEGPSAPIQPFEAARLNVPQAATTFDNGNASVSVTVTVTYDAKP